MQLAKKNIQLNNQTSNINNQEKTKHQTPIINSRLGYWKLVTGVFLMFVSWLLVITPSAASKDYDGIWFIGFNVKSPVFKNLAARQAVNQAIDKEYIAQKIASTEVTPASPIPPKMLGYDPDLKAAPFDLKAAKTLLKTAGFSVSDQRIKNLSLLHTDGLKTIEIAKKIQNELRRIGMKVSRTEVSYEKETKWIKELASGKHDMYLMGYKAGIEQLFTKEAEAKAIDGYNLVEPLFKTDADASFTNYSNAEIDKLLSQIDNLNLALKSERDKKLRRINQIIYQDLPVIVLFYIEKL